MAPEIDFAKPVVMAADCEPCECCGEPWCATCDDHYADCSCPGPHSEPDEDRIVVVTVDD